MGDVFVSYQNCSSAGIDIPAFATYIMTGFDDEKECLDAWSMINPNLSITVDTLDAFLQKKHPPRFRDNSGRAGVIKAESYGSYYYFTSWIPDITEKLLQHNIVIIDVVDNIGSQFTYNAAEMGEIPKINGRIDKEILFGKGYTGSYIYTLNNKNSLEGLNDLLSKSKVMYEDQPLFLLVYVDQKISVIQDMESKFIHIPHESILFGRDDLFWVQVTEQDIINRLIGGRSQIWIPVVNGML